MGFIARLTGPREAEFHAPVSAPRPAGEPLPYSKLCELEDFMRPELQRHIREIMPGVCRDIPSYPRGREHRKLWEVAMAARTLTDLGVVRPDAEVLGVGAGDEATLYWLTTRVRRVFATDLYLDSGAWTKEASPVMLTDPGRNAPCPWDRRRLVVQHMNALDLQYADDSFDGVFSSSSIEHFGSHGDVKQAAREMQRVLKPGGIATLSTEFRLRGPRPGIPGVLMFDADELRELIIEAADWELVSDLSLEISSDTLATELGYADVLAGRDSLPHIVLCQGSRAWTSVHLALRKDGERAGISVPASSATSRLPHHLYASRQELESVSRGLSERVYLGSDMMLARILGCYKMYVDTRDASMSPHFALDGFWESWITVAIARAVSDGMYCVDVGANHGYYALVLAHAVGPGGRVLAVEPNPRLASLLRTTLEINGFGECAHVVEAALSDADGDLAELRVPTGHLGRASIVGAVNDDDSVVAVLTATLDSLTKDWPRVDFVKVDAEGAEEAIWAGMQRVIAENPQLTIALEVNAARYRDPEEFLARIETAGFRLSEIDYDGSTRVVGRQEILGRDAQEIMLILKRT